MTKDLVKRLREKESRDNRALLDEAADAIERHVHDDEPCAYCRSGGVLVEDTVNFWGPAADLLLKSGVFKDGVYRIGTVPVLRQVMELAADPSEYSQLNAEFALREILQNIYNEKF